MVRDSAPDGRHPDVKIMGWPLDTVIDTTERIHQADRYEEAPSPGQFPPVYNIITQKAQ